VAGAGIRAQGKGGCARKSRAVLRFPLHFVRGISIRCTNLNLLYHGLAVVQSCSHASVARNCLTALGKVLQSCFRCTELPHCVRQGPASVARNCLTAFGKVPPSQCYGGQSLLPLHGIDSLRSARSRLHNVTAGKACVLLSVRSK